MGSAKENSEWSKHESRFRDLLNRLGELTAQWTKEGDFPERWEPSGSRQVVAAFNTTASLAGHSLLHSSQLPASPDPEPRTSDPINAWLNEIKNRKIGYDYLSAARPKDSKGDSVGFLHMGEIRRVVESSILLCRQLACENEVRNNETVSERDPDLSAADPAVRDYHQEEPGSGKAEDERQTDSEEPQALPLPSLPRKALKRIEAAEREAREQLNDDIWPYSSHNPEFSFLEESIIRSTARTRDFIRVYAEDILEVRLREHLDSNPSQLLQNDSLLVSLCDEVKSLADTTWQGYLSRISDLAPLTARVYTLTRRSATISSPGRERRLRRHRSSPLLAPHGG